MNAPNISFFLMNKLFSIIEGSRLARVTFFRCAEDQTQRLDFPGSVGITQSEGRLVCERTQDN